MRPRFPTWAVVALSALAAGALGIAASLAVTDADKWPGWLRPYHRWGWPAVWVLLLAAAALAAWQATRQPNPPADGASSTVLGKDSGPVAGGDVTVRGGQGPTAGRDLITIITSPQPTPSSEPEPPTIPTTTGDVQPEIVEASPPTVEEDLKALKELRPLLHESVYVRFQERIVIRRFPHLGS